MLTCSAEGGHAGEINIKYGVMEVVGCSVMRVEVNMVVVVCDGKGGGHESTRRLGEYY